MEETEITVCIPHLMRENLLMKCLENLRKNMNLPYRVIIINDGKHPLSFKDKRIQVINNLERRGLGSARKQFSELVETEYLFALDNDIFVKPRSIELQLEALQNDDSLGAVSGLEFSGGRFSGRIADFKFIGNKIVKKYYALSDILRSESDLFEADFIPISYTLFRMKAVEDIEFDPNYKIGYEHWDTFLQLYYTKWKCAVHRKSLFEHLRHESSKNYRKARLNMALLKASKEYFIQKWGCYPVHLSSQKISEKILLWTVNWLRLLKGD